jgi:hypothetical protein
MGPAHLLKAEVNDVGPACDESGQPQLKSSMAGRAPAVCRYQKGGSLGRPAGHMDAIPSLEIRPGPNALFPNPIRFSLDFVYGIFFSRLGANCRPALGEGGGRPVGHGQPRADDDLSSHLSIGKQGK